MAPNNDDLEATLEFAQSHDLARRYLPITLWVLLVGLFLMTSLDGSDVKRSHIFLGALGIALSIIFLGVIVWRRTQASVPAIILSREGVIFRDLSEKLIPWNEIRDVSQTRVSNPHDFFSRKVMKLTVASHFYRTLSGDSYKDTAIARDLDPAEIYLSYYHILSFEAFRRALLLRWHALSRHAEGKTPPPEIVQAGSETHHRNDADEQSPRRPTRAISRPTSFASVRAIGALVRASSLGELIATGLALAGIVALLTNNAGLWSTAAQERGRAEAAEWRARQEKFDADRAATDADQRRLQEGMDATRKCMDDYWALLENGTYERDPDCMKKGK